MKIRRLTALLVVAALIVTAVPLTAHAADHRCYYDPTDMQTYGCTDNDVKMLALKIKMDATLLHLDDLTWDTYWSDYTEAFRLSQEDENLAIDLYSPISKYQTLDSVMIGSNTKFTVLPDRQILVQDRYRRPIRLKGEWTTSSTKAVVNFFLSILGGMAIPVPAEVLGFINSSKVLTGATGLFTVGWSYVTSSLPEAGMTELLYHIVNTTGDGTRQVYRVNLHVSADGKIAVIGSKNKTWTYVGDVEPGSDDW